MQYFSKTTGGFYHSEIHGGSMPPDVVGVPDEEYAALFAGQAQGFAIVPSEQGRPMLAPHAQEPYVEQKARELAAFRVLREQYLNRLAGLMVASLVAGDTEAADAAATMRLGLLDLPAHPDVQAASTLEGLKDAMQAVYAALVAATPARLREQFAKVDQ